ncbi:MAG TPA: DUF4142 domain-containing protein [Bdellovibrionota bacterium]|nr:DUF4142 domain-containing protein [Bdellovibrionota bacterium]
MKHSLAFKWMALSLAGFTAGLLFAPEARGASAAPTDAAFPSEIASQIHATNQEEARAGKLAMERGGTPEIRRYGDLLMRDHKRADQSIQELARKEHLNLSMLTVDPETKTHHALLMQQLEQTTGIDFDRAFLTGMREGHDQAIRELTQAHDQLPMGSPVRGFIAKLIPILKQHDRLAANLAGAAASVAPPAVKTSQR